jgi:hypothetical protein
MKLNEIKLLQTTLRNVLITVTKKAKLVHDETFPKMNRINPT